MSTTPGKPDTIILIRGSWLTPQSWEHSITYYEASGYRVMAPAYPGIEVEMEALNKDPSPILKLTVEALLERCRGSPGTIVYSSDERQNGRSAGERLAKAGQTRPR